MFEGNKETKGTQTHEFVPISSTKKEYWRKPKIVKDVIERVWISAATCSTAAQSGLQCIGAFILSVGDKKGVTHCSTHRVTWIKRDKSQYLFRSHFSEYDGTLSCVASYLSFWFFRIEREFLVILTTMFPRHFGRTLDTEDSAIQLPTLRNTFRRIRRFGQYPIGLILDIPSWFIRAVAFLNIVKVHNPLLRTISYRLRY